MRFRILGLALVATALLGFNAPAPRVTVDLTRALPDTPGQLSVMTYNVEGLPWPVRWNRDADLETIGLNLAALRTVGRQPHVVVLQEAFSQEARAIPQRAGYRYVVSGPNIDARSAAPPTAADRSFMAGASWLHGERQGKTEGSGLLMMSDYPVLKVARMVYPAFACAGFDCLANKGALLVTLAVPGAPRPVEVLDTHLNSRRAAGVSDARSLIAYRRQGALLAQFVAANHDARNPLIVAGDFNVGAKAGRVAAIADARAAMDTRRQGLRDGLSGALTGDAGAAGPEAADFAAIRHRARDWQFLYDGTDARLVPTAAQVPFGGTGAAGPMLSDHIGYSVSYAITG